MANRIGLLGVLKRGAVGSTAGTTMTNVKDLTTSGERGEGDISNRASEMELTETTMLKHDLGWKMNFNEADGDYQAILAAFLNNTAIALMALSQSSGEGWDADYKIARFQREEPLRGIIEMDVLAKPTYVSRYPVWHESS